MLQSWGAEKVKDHKLMTQINSINLDLSLIKCFGHQRDNQFFSEFKSIGNLSQLSQRLKLANNQLNYEKKQKDQASQWMKEKGVDLRPMIDKIRESKKQIVVEAAPSVMKEWLPIDFSIITEDNQDSYLHKCRESTVSVAIKQSLICNGDRARDLQNRVLNKLEGIQANSYRPQQENNEEEQANVSQIINSILGQCLEHDILNQLPTKLYEALPKGEHNYKWLDILINQIECQHEFKDDHRCETAIVVKTLEWMEEQYSRFIDSNGQISDILRTYYFDKQSDFKETNSDKEKDLFWGKVYLTYRAGRKENFYGLISRERFPRMREYLKEYDQTVLQFEPVPVSQSLDAKAVKSYFYQQLIFIFQADPKFTSTKFTQNHEVLADLPWIILRTLGLYKSTNSSIFELYWQVIDKLKLKYLSKSCWTLYNLTDLICLGAYREIIECYEKFGLPRSEGRAFSESDYTILLMVLLESPNNFKDRESQQFLRNKCQARIIQQAIQLKQKGLKHDYQSFVCLLLNKLKRQAISDNLQQSQMLQNLSQISHHLFSRKQDFLNCDFKSFKEALSKYFTGYDSESIFQNIMVSALQRLKKQNYDDYVFVAQQCKDLLKENAKYKQFQFLLRMLIDEAIKDQKPQEIKRRKRIEQTDYDLIYGQVQVEQFSMEKKQKDLAKYQQKILKQLHQLKQSKPQYQQSDKKGLKIASQFVSAYRQLDNFLTNRKYKRLGQWNHFEWVYGDVSQEEDKYNKLSTLLIFLDSLGNNSTDLYLHFIKKMIRMKEILYHQSSNLGGLADFKIKLYSDFTRLTREYSIFDNRTLIEDIKASLKERK